MSRKRKGNRRRPSRNRPAKPAPHQQSFPSEAGHPAGDATLPDFWPLVPPGWLDNKPALAGRTPAECAEFRSELLSWVADGLEAAQVGNDTNLETPDHSVCWEGQIVKIRRRSADVAAAVFAVAGGTANKHGCSVKQHSRRAVGLDSSDRRVVGCWCDHETCLDSEQAVLEMQWPVANAALTWHSPDLGSVVPAADVPDQLTVEGLTRVMSQMGADSGGFWSGIVLGSETARPD